LLRFENSIEHATKQHNVFLEALGLAKLPLGKTE